MNKSKQPINSHENYHAHIYFDENSTVLAKKLCAMSADTFLLSVGRFHEKLVGPHPCWSCQVSFTAKDFDSYVSWLNANRESLTIFIHPVTDNALQDHAEFAYWLGQEVKLNLEIFKR